MLGLVMDWQVLLHFWFGSFTEDGFSAPLQRSKWFIPDSDFDKACEQAAGTALTSVRQGDLDHWLDHAEGRLAYILLCDQLPRNIFRGQANAYGWDELALHAAREGVLNGADRVLNFDQRAFFYMPFEHSENILDQHTAVGLFAQLRDASPAARRELTGNNLRYAQQHRDVILRFGRFPHRNEVLGRTSSPEELEFVAAGDGFGQSVKK